MDRVLARTFGDNLKAYREARGLTQEQLANQLGKHKTYVSGIERGQRNLSFSIAERLAAEIGAHPLAMMKIPPSDPSAPQP